MEQTPLKLKFKLNQLEFELEGNEEIVRGEFEKFRLFIANDLLPKMNSGTKPGLNLIVDDQSDEQEAPKNDQPISLQELVYKDVARSEADWILIYSAFITNFKVGKFTIQMIHDKYQESGRKNDNRLKNLSNNVKALVRKDYFGVHNNAEFILKESGLNAVKDLIGGKSGKAKRTINQTKQPKGVGKQLPQEKKKPTSRGLELDSSLNLHPDGHESLKDFYKQYNIQGNAQLILVIAYYLKEKLKLDHVGASQIYTAMDDLGIAAPETLQQVITNEKNKHGYFKYSGDSIELTMKGRNAIKFELLNKS